jgi:gp16 family phage-associated protein
MDLTTGTSHHLRSRQQARRWFEAEGISVSDWAKANGFRRDVVYAVLAGRTRGRRGAAHRVAVALGIKAGSVQLGAGWPEQGQLFEASSESTLEAVMDN